MSGDLSKLVGSVVADRYRVQESLGHGTMGAVYRAEHIHMKKTVAIKVLHPSHTRDPEVVERFQREAQAAANIEHPNICTATDFGRIDQNFYYLVMEYLEGRPLIDIIKAKESFPPLRALHIGIQMLSALEVAHELGVVHRDLKPENVILIEKDGDRDFVKITDFGVAQVRLFKDAARLTQAGVVYGSPLYMSPQQAGGKEIDHRADLYSVGVMLYELLTGTLPFYAKSLMVVLNMHIADPPPPFAVANPQADIPREIEFIVMKLLAKEPEDRFQTAQEARTELEKLQNALRAPAPVRAQEPADEGDERRRRIQTGIVLFFGAMFVLWGVFLVVKVLSSTEEVSLGADPVQKNGEMVFDRTDVRTEEQRAEFESRPDVTAALALMADDPESAIGAFGKISAAEPTNPHARFLLGRAHFSANNLETAFAEYAKAIELAPHYAADSKLQDDVIRRLENGKGSDVELAEKFIKNKLGPAANPRLAGIAEHHNVRKVRKRAFRTLKESKQFENLPEWNQSTIQLRHAVGCEENLRWVKKIAELGDPRAVGALRRFGALPKTGCGENEKEDCYVCLRDDLRVAIAQLERAPR